MTTFDEVINLYYRHDKYKKNTYPELYYHILPSINLNQYKIFKDQNGILEKGGGHAMAAGMTLKKGKIP